MSVLNHSLLLAADADTYQISRSLRFNRVDSASLSRTPGTAGNRTTWTFSCWVKRTAFSENGQTLFTGGTNGANSTRLAFDTTNRLVFENEVGGGTTQFRVTTAVYRDPGAWMHVVLAVDTTLASAGDRVRLWVNGVEVTAFSVSSTPALNLQLQVNAANVHYIGQSFTPTYANFYLAEVYHVDGLALQASNFGEFDATTGVWNPKAATGITSYGTCGFRLTFSDNSAATATALGKDAAGSNNWTPNNISVTAGTGNDSLVDTPTNYGTDTGAGGEVRGNYATLSQLKPSGNALTLSNGNLFAEGTGNRNTTSSIAFPSSGKWYCEITIISTPTTTVTQETIGVSGDIDNYVGTIARAYAANGQCYNGTAWVAFGSTWSVNDVIGVAVNIDASQLSFYKNGVQQGTTQSYSFPVGSSCIIISAHNTNTTQYFANFGQRPFAYTAPSGFKALCTTNLSAPTIANGTTAMDVVTYTGTGSSLTPTSSLGFSPNFVWIKSRSLAATGHAIYDMLRGATIELASDQTAAETTQTLGLTSFNSNGFTVGNTAKVNSNAQSYVAWCWDESVTDGFDIVTYNGTGTSTTIAHSLGVAPSFVIVKHRNGATHWAVWHSSIPNTNYLQLSSQIASTSGTDVWNSTSPTSTNFSVGTNTRTNASGGSYVAYLWAPVSQFSAFGSYLGNASADGPFVYLGFRPALIILKSITVADDWVIIDDKRLGYNQANYFLVANNGDDEPATELLDITSSGFKVRTTATNVNGSGATHIYAAWAESPFQYARAR